jgi:predicted nucleic acid-binding protein
MSNTAKREGEPNAASLKEKVAEQRKDSRRGLLERMSERWSRIPAEERARIPADGAQNLDHYLYGAPKA